MSRPRRVRAGVAALLLGAGGLTLAVAGAARAAVDETAAPAGLGGYSLVARAHPLQITYDSPGLLPVSPIVQVSVPESYASLASGPSGYSLASLAFPGPLLADLGTVIRQTSAACQPPFAVPVYPLRSEAFFPQGPTDTDISPIPGGRMHATANGPLSTAFGAIDDLAFPAIFGIGSATGTSSSEGKDDAAVTKARSVVSGFKLLAGMISIDSIVTDITATSSGDTGKTEGTTTVSGATIGMQKVTIDEKGVTLAGTPVGGLAALLQSAGQSLNDALVQSGITIKVLRHQETKDGGLAERVAGGVVIDINYNGRTAPLLSTLLAGVPANQLSPTNLTECAPSSPQGLFNLLKETHIESFALGGATVSSNGSAGFGLPSLDVDATIPGLPDLSGADLGGDLTGGLSELGSSAGTGTAVGAGTLRGNVGTGGGFTPGEGIPAGFILLLLALFPVLGVLARRLADATLAGGAAAATCPLEGDRSNG